MASNQAFEAAKERPGPVASHKESPYSSVVQQQVSDFASAKRSDASCSTANPAGTSHLDLGHILPALDLGTVESTDHPLPASPKAASADIAPVTAEAAKGQRPGTNLTSCDNTPTSPLPANPEDAPQSTTVAAAAAGLVEQRIPQAVSAARLALQAGMSVAEFAHGDLGGGVRRLARTAKGVTSMTGAASESEGEGGGGGGGETRSTVDEGADVLEQAKNAQEHAESVSQVSETVAELPEDGKVLRGITDTADHAEKLLTAAIAHLDQGWHAIKASASRLPSEAAQGIEEAKSAAEGGIEHSARTVARSAAGKTEAAMNAVGERFGSIGEGMDKALALVGTDTEGFAAFAETTGKLVAGAGAVVDAGIGVDKFAQGDTVGGMNHMTEAVTFGAGEVVGGPVTGSLFQGAAHVYLGATQNFIREHPEDVRGMYSGGMV